MPNVNDEALVREIRAELLAAPKTATTNAAATTATADNLTSAFTDPSFDY
jgi:hypothetical protein